MGPLYNGQELSPSPYPLKRFAMIEPWINGTSSELRRYLRPAASPNVALALRILFLLVLSLYNCSRGLD